MVYVLWSMHGSQAELKADLRQLQPYAVKAISGGMSGSLAQLADSSRLAAAEERLAAFGAQIAALEAAEAAAADMAAEAAVSAGLPSDVTAADAAAPGVVVEQPVQQQTAREPTAALPANDAAEADQGHADTSEPPPSSSSQSKPATRAEIGAGAASVPCSHAATAPRSSEPRGDGQRHEAAFSFGASGGAAVASTDARPADDSQHCSEAAASIGDGNAAEAAVYSPQQSAPPGRAAARPGTHRGKENSLPGLPQKRAASAADCAVEPPQVRQALTASATAGSQRDAASRWQRAPTPSSLDSTTMSDAFIDFDCLG